MPVASRASRSPPASSACRSPAPDRGRRCGARDRRSRPWPIRRIAALAVVVLLIGYGYDLVPRDGLVVAAVRGRHPDPAGLRLVRCGRGPPGRSSRRCSRWRCSPVPRWRSPTPGPTSSGIGPPGSVSVATRPRRSTGHGGCTPRSGRRPPSWRSAGWRSAGRDPSAVALVIVAAGLIAGRWSIWSRHREPAGRERAWQFEAVGAAAWPCLAWLAAAIA